MIGFISGASCLSLRNFSSATELMISCKLSTPIVSIFTSLPYVSAINSFIASMILPCTFMLTFSPFSLYSMSYWSLQLLISRFPLTCSTDPRTFPPIIPTASFLFLSISLKSPFIHSTSIFIIRIVLHRFCMIFMWISGAV